MRAPGARWQGRAAATGVARLAVVASIICSLSSFAQEQPAAEVTTHETEPSFRIEAQRNLVLVRAVVRDAKGRPVAGLKKEDFQVFDGKKLQTITNFSEEFPSRQVPTSLPPEEIEDEADAEAARESVPPPSTPQRYLALYFDDVHLKFEDLARTRQASERYLGSALTPGDRAGIFTSSGRQILDFTDDRGKLHETLLKLFPQPIVSPREDTCPEVLNYQSYLIVHRDDPFALEVATAEALECMPEQANLNPEAARMMAENHARQEAMRALNGFQHETEYALRGLEQLIRRLAILPGQRNIILLSPGFLMFTAEHRVNSLVERALRASVVINTLDAKGLYAPAPLGDISKRGGIPGGRVDLLGRKTQLALNEVSMAADVLRTLAYDTGGEFFSNNNDFDEGFRRTGALPEVFYLLAFSPQNLKLDGRFHPLKITLAKGLKYNVRARAGYHAPRRLEDATQQATEEITQAIFSRDELNELPIQIQTQFFKLNELDARLSVLTRLDVKFIRFRKENGRSLNHVTLVTALFDRDGKYVTGKEKTIEFRLLEGSLEKLGQSGLSARTSFDVKPGTYIVRQVVRDAEGAQITALNRTVEIPF